MGREVKRVPLDFEWPMYTVWWGYILKDVPCQTCKENRKAIRPSGSCSTCGGAGKVRPRVEVPVGTGYQLWETVTKGSPVSPVFTTPQKLARWIMKNEAEAAGDMPFSNQDWLEFIVNTGGPPGTVLMEKRY